jgi:hypothetical protein
LHDSFLLLAFGEQIVEGMNQCVQCIIVVIFIHKTHCLKLRHSAKLLQAGGGGAISVGLGSGPAALLMVPLMCAAVNHQGVRVVDMRHVILASDPNIESVVELRAGFEYPEHLRPRLNGRPGTMTSVGCAGDRNVWSVKCERRPSGKTPRVIPVRRRWPVVSAK